MQKYLEQIKPQVSDTWRADELFIKVSGNLKYLFAMLDDETRFLIAQEVADTKNHMTLLTYLLNQERLQVKSQ